MGRKLLYVYIQGWTETGRWSVHRSWGGDAPHKAETVILYQIKLHALLLWFLFLLSRHPQALSLSLALAVPRSLLRFVSGLQTPSHRCLLPLPCSSRIGKIFSVRWFPCSDRVTALFKALRWLHCIQQSYFNPPVVLPMCTSPSWFCVCLPSSSSSPITCFSDECFCTFSCTVTKEWEKHSRSPKPLPSLLSCLPNPSCAPKAAACARRALSFAGFSSVLVPTCSPCAPSSPITNLIHLYSLAFNFVVL